GGHREPAPVPRIGRSDRAVRAPGGSRGVLGRGDPAGDTHPAAPVSSASAVWAASRMVKKLSPLALGLAVDCLPAFLAHSCLQKPCPDVQGSRRATYRPFFETTSCSHTTPRLHGGLGY